MKFDELMAAQAAGFHCVPSRVQVERGDLVVARYSALPYYKETADDIEYLGAKLINSHRQHCFIADMRNWVEVLKELTPKTWYRPEEVPLDEPGSFVLKGETNSKKEAWSTSMFAETRQDVSAVHSRLLDDTLIGAQDIYVRKYVPLVTYAHGIAGLPITKEFRLFVFRQIVLSGAYYWSSFREDCLDADDSWVEPCVDEIPPDFLQEAISRISPHATFYALDVAQDVTGRWWVIEINDGQMSGLSGNKPEVLYPRLFESLI